jgi:hypothetical protein
VCRQIFFTLGGFLNFENFKSVENWSVSLDFFKVFVLMYNVIHASSFCYLLL